MNDKIKDIITDGILEGFNQGIELSAQTLELIVDIFNKTKTLTESEKEGWKQIITLVRVNKKETSNG